MPTISKESQIKYYKNELNKTDYVVIKIAEAEINGEDTTALKKKYAGILAERKKIREEINELEATNG